MYRSWWTVIGYVADAVFPLPMTAPFSCTATSDISAVTPSTPDTPPPPPPPVPPLLDQKPPVGVSTSAGPSPPTRPMPGLSSISGAVPRTESSDTDPAGENSSNSGGGGAGPDPSLLEPLQEMTEGEEPLQVRREVDSPAAKEGSNSPANGAGGAPTQRSAPDAGPPAKRIKVSTGWKWCFFVDWLDIEMTGFCYLCWTQ